MAALGIAAVMSAGLRAWNVEFEGWNLHLGRAWGEGKRREI